MKQVDGLQGQPAPLTPHRLTPRPYSSPLPAPPQVDGLQGQRESDLLARITAAGVCAHIVTYYTLEAAPDGRIGLATGRDVIFLQAALLH